jgi:hypothetical protein
MDFSDPWHDVRTKWRVGAFVDDTNQGIMDSSGSLSIDELSRTTVGNASAHLRRKPESSKVLVDAPVLALDQRTPPTYPLDNERSSSSHDQWVKS